MFACAKAGAILHPISWRLAPAEVAFQLDDAEPAVFLIEDEYRELGEAALALANVRPALDGGRLARRAGPAAVRRRPTAPDLHVGDDREAQGRVADARELLLDEPLVRPGDGHQARRRDAPGAAPVPLRRLERAVDPRLVEGSEGRPRARLRPGPGARPDRARAGDDADGRARELPLHVAGAAVRRGRPELRSGSPSSAVPRCRRRCSTSGPPAASTSCRGTASPRPHRTSSACRPRTRGAGPATRASRTRTSPVSCPRERAARARAERLPGLLAQR